MYSGPGNMERQVAILSDVWVYRKLKMAAITGSKKDITYISASMHDSNKVPTAKPMFSGSSYTFRLLRRLPDVRICEKSKMVA